LRKESSSSLKKAAVQARHRDYLQTQAGEYEPFHCSMLSWTFFRHS
jgi:hypothetical protein